jgi:hypothetical protein
LKKCSRCKLEKDFECFVKHRRNNDGLYSYCKPCHRARKKEKRYGLKVTCEQFYEDNNHICAICGTTDTIQGQNTLCIDHCHASNKVRGLLCKSCNIGIGEFKDNKRLLLNAIDYLEEYESN